MPSPDSGDPEVATDTRSTAAALSPLDIAPPDLFRELRHVASRFLAHERPGTLQPTALVNEAFLRLLGADPGRPLSRQHFFASACRCMSHVIIDHARRKRALKRTPPADTSVAREPARQETLDPLEVEELIAKLDGIAPRAAQIVRLRFYLGLTIAQTAVAMDISPSTVEHDWRFARACLSCWLSDGPADRNPAAPA
jgi:RNA polymerase sigma factor (TIGR02999 family)